MPEPNKRKKIGQYVPPGLLPWITPPLLPTKARKEQLEAEAALSKLTPQEGVPAGYTRTQFGQLVKTPSGYKPPLTAEEEATAKQEAAMGFPTKEPQPGYRWVWDSSTMRYVQEPAPTTPSTAITPYQQAQLTYQQQQDAQAQANWQAQQAWQQQQAAQQQAWQQQQAEQERQRQQEQMGWYQQQAQMQQAEQERQYRSQLAASPMNWLQYASYTGEQPVIQPWMLPLMPQQYAGTTAGEQIPGWQGRGGSMTALPGLTTPSAQYWARMGPTAQQQYMGYQQGQGGINPMETQFRLQSQAPPGGRNYGLTWGR